MPVRTPHFLVAGFVSEASIPINVTLIVGSLANPANTAEVYSNLTVVHPHQVLTAYDAAEAANELTLEFPWAWTQDLPQYPFPMQLIVTVYYMSDDGRNTPFSNTLYNNTVSFVAKSEPLDYAAYLPHAATLLAMAVFAYLFPAAFPETTAMFVKPSPPSDAERKKAKREARGADSKEGGEESFESILPAKAGGTPQRKAGRK